MPCTTSGSYGARSEHDRGHVGDGAAHADESVRGRDAVEAAELAGDGGQRLVQLFPADGAAEPELRGEAHGADVQAELLVHLGAAAEGELRAAAAGVEDDHASPRRGPARPSPPDRPAGPPPLRG